jgi:ankyrin repeat protein
MAENDTEAGAPAPAELEDEDVAEEGEWEVIGGHQEVIRWLADRYGAAADLDAEQGGNEWEVTRAGAETTVPTAAEAADNNGLQPIHRASAGGNLDMVQLLAANGVSLIAQDNYDRQPIHHACRGGHLEVIRWLVANGVELTAKDKFGGQPIHDACRGGHLEVVEWLAGMDRELLTVRDKNGLQPIHSACQGGHLEVVEWLVANGVELYAETKFCMQPIHHACGCGHLEVVECLVDRCGALLNAKANLGWRPIHFACWGGHLDVVEWLAANGVSLIAQDKHDRQPIHHACRGGHLKVVEWLAGMDRALLTVRDKDGLQPIHHACWGGHLEVIRWLADRPGVSLTAGTSRRDQPIHLAFDHGHLELVSWLADQEGVLPYPIEMRHEWPLFIMKKAVITQYAIPCILRENPIDVFVNSIKFPDDQIAQGRLGRNYCPRGRAHCEGLGEANKFAMEMQSYFVEGSRQQELSLLLNMDVYKSSGQMSGVFYRDITTELALTSALDGVTLNRDCVVLIDKKYSSVHDRMVRIELKHLIHGVMYVWRAPRGIVVLDQTKEVLHFNFNADFWGRILDELTSLATDPRTRLRLHVQGQARASARGEDEGSMANSQPGSQVSHNPSPHALTRASERNISESDIQDAKTHGFISLQFPFSWFNHEIPTDVEVIRASDTLLLYGTGLVEEFNVTLGRIRCGNERFELELVGSENQGVRIKEWLKDNNYFETGLRMQYAHAQRQNQWELVVEAIAPEGL